jgi:phosphatidate cytidylyltransferase
MVRLASGLALAAAAIAAIRFLPVPALRVTAAIVAALAAHEYLAIAGTTSLRRQAVPLVATMALCVLVGMQRPIDTSILLLAALGWVATDVLATGRSARDTAADLIAPVYVGVPLGMLVAVHVLLGWQATLLIVALVIVSDSAQYYAGRSLGRRLLAPAISPKKTVEGFLGGLAAGTFFMALAGPRIVSGAGAVAFAALGAALVTLGVCGDLFESRLKRLAGVKDSSALIPGHGGVLDRIDALLFAVPAFYLFIRSLGQA